VIAPSTSVADGAQGTRMDARADRTESTPQGHEVASLLPPADRLEKAFELAREGRVAEKRRELNEALAHYAEARELIHDLSPTPLLANLLRWMGSVHRDLGNTADAERSYVESLRIAELTGTVSGQAAALNCRAVMAQRKGDLSHAVALYRRAARLATEAGEIRLAGMIEQNLGVLANIRGDLDGALVRYRAALRAFQRVGDDEALSWVLNNMGMLLNDLNLSERAEKSFVQGLEIARARRDRPMEGILLTNYAEGLIAMRRWDEAQEVLTQALLFAREGGDTARVAEALKFKGVLERERGNFAEAGKHLGEAHTLARSVDDPLLVSEVLRESGELRLREGNVTGAVGDWTEALAGFEKLEAHLDVKAIRTRLASVAGPDMTRREIPS
jgi:tetratricopeptide (TPR) repeat protein